MNRKGFTLVEIMIVVAIIALLTAIAIPNLLRARVNANDTAALALLKTVSTSLENYAAANGGAYPVDATLAALAGDNLFAGTLTPPYIDPLKLVTPQFGHTITCVSTAAAYTLIANVVTNGVTGTRNHRITTGAIESSQDGGTPY